MTRVTNVPDLREIPPIRAEITEAALDGKLVLFVGAGVSMLMGLPSWSDFSLYALEQLRFAGVLNHADVEQLSWLKDPKKELSIAIQLASSRRVDLDLAKPFKMSKSTCDVYKYINAIGCSYVTTNYDKYLIPISEDDRYYEKDKLRISHLDRPKTVVHLHGCISKPDTMIVSTRDYLQHYDDDYVQEFLSHLFTNKTVLFIGYGLEEAEILEHILRRGNVRRGVENRRFVLQGFFTSQKPLYENLFGYYKESFGVELIGFVRDHQDYGQQVDIFENWSSKIRVKPPRLTNDIDFMSEVLGDE